MGLLEALNKQKIINSIENVEKKEAETEEKKDEIITKDPYVAFKDRLQQETVTFVNDNHNTNPLVSKEQYVRSTIQNFILKDELAIPKEDQEEVIDCVTAEIIGLDRLISC